MDYRNWYCVQVASGCEQKAKADAERKRAEDVKHRSIINNSILDYMKRKGCPEDAAKEIIKGIVKKETQNIYIKY